MTHHNPHLLTNFNALGTLADLTLSLAEQFPAALSSKVAAELRDQIDRELGYSAEHVFHLMRTKAKGEDRKAALTAAQRLSSPRFVTTPRGERRRILAKHALQSASELAEILPTAIELALKLKVLEFEIAQEDLRDELVDESKEVKIDTKLYQSVKKTSDLLYKLHGITYNDWSNLSDDEVAQFARILLSTRHSGRVNADDGGSVAHDPSANQTQAK